MNVVSYQPGAEELSYTFGGRPAVGRVQPGTIVELYTEDCRLVDPLTETVGREAFLDAVTQFLDAFRIESIHVDEVIEQAPAVAVRWSWTVTHKGEYLGVPPSGRRFETWNVMLLELRANLSNHAITFGEFH